jgi:hypothetical protein
VLAAAVGLGLMADAIGKSSATYDEVTYLEVATHWWRSGDQEAISRMGSPLTFWKIQHAPVLFVLDLFDPLSRNPWIDDPIPHQGTLLPIVRAWELTIWLIAFGLTALWSHRLYGVRAMALAVWIFTLSPNLLAHGMLATMEMPLVASTTGMFFLFWKFLTTGDRRAFWGAAALGGLAWSCKFTTVLLPPILGVVWVLERWRAGEPGRFRIVLHVARDMMGFVAVLLLTDIVLTGFATLALSTTRGQGHPLIDRWGVGALKPWVERAIETPIPQDWVGFATQIFIQRSGGWSYLFGQTQHTGWWYYYFVALAVKMPLSFGMLMLARALGKTSASFLPPLGKGGSSDIQDADGNLALVPETPPNPTLPRGDETRRLRSLPSVHAPGVPLRGDLLIPLTIVFFLAATATGSSRNYGVRYLLPLSPLAIVWVSALAEGGKAARSIAALGLVGQAIAVASCHPYELSYFNVLAGGPAGGRHILADSNLDWGQGLRCLARLQRERPELCDLTLYYFGLTEPRHYGVKGRSYVIDAEGQNPRIPRALSAETEYLAVSTSLQWGPWGPQGYFQCLNRVQPGAVTEDSTIAIYRVRDCPELAYWQSLTIRQDGQRIGAIAP